MRATRQQTLQDLHTNRTLSDTSKKRILVLERRTGSRDLVQNVEVHAREIRRAFPVGANLALEVQEGNLVGGDGGDVRHVRVQEL